MGTYRRLDHQQEVRGKSLTDLFAGFLSRLAGP